MYTLYYSPGAASMAVHWMLLQIGAPFALEKIDLAAKAQHAPAYLALNPGGHVPTLVVDGVPRAECAALLLLLAERHPEAGLMPAMGAASRAEFLQTLFYLANTLQPAFRNWFYADEAAGPANSEATMAHARARIEGAWSRLDSQFEDGRAFLNGTSLTATDFLATMLMRWSRSMLHPATDYPHLAHYVRRMSELPSFRAVNEREGLADWPPRHLLGTST
jgi:glutathione S-transferase